MQVLKARSASFAEALAEAEMIAAVMEAARSREHSDDSADQR